MTGKFVKISKDSWIEIFGPLPDAEAESLAETIQGLIPDYVNDDTVMIWTDTE